MPDEDFLPGAEKQSKLSLSDLRTLEPTKNGPLTAADVKAFTGTLDKVNAFTKDLKTMIGLIPRASLLTCGKRKTDGDRRSAC